MLAALRRRGSTILLIEHETEAAEHADRLLLMADGRIVADGAPATWLRDVEPLWNRLGVRPLDLDRLGAALGWPDRVADIDEAARGCAPARARAAASRRDAGRRLSDASAATPTVRGRRCSRAEGVEFTYPSGTARRWPAFR